MIVESPEILAQNCPTSTSETVLYVASGQTAISSFTVCNITVSNAKFDLIIAKGGAATANKHYIYYRLNVSPTQNNFTATVGYTLSAGDVVRIKSDTANALSFSLFGIRRYETT